MTTWGPDDPLTATLAAQAEGTVQADVPLAPLTTLRVGGNARTMVTAESTADLLAVGRACADHGVGWLVVGKGSNLLVADAGWDGVAVVLGRGFRGVEVQPHVDGEPAGVRQVLVGGAEGLKVLANRMRDAGLGGFAFGRAIPGSVGGSVRMNAGVPRHEMADVLRWAEVVRLRGQAVERWHPTELRMGYRHSQLPDDAVVTRVCLALREADRDEIAADMDEMARWRTETQPVNAQSCGSVFRNPPGDKAGRLIDQAGLKGFRRGGAAVSTKHANFITIDKGTPAAADDVHGIIRHVQATVKAQFDVDLQTEVVRAGFGEEA